MVKIDAFSMLSLSQKTSIQYTKRCAKDFAHFFQAQQQCSFQLDDPAFYMSYISFDDCSLNRQNPRSKTGHRHSGVFIVKRME